MTLNFNYESLVVICDNENSVQCTYWTIFAIYSRTPCAVVTDPSGLQALAFRVVSLVVSSVKYAWC